MKKTKVILFVWIIVSLYFIANIYLKCHLNSNEFRGTLFDIGFAFGDLIRNIVETGEYKGRFYDFLPFYFSVHRLPLIPYFLILISKIANTHAMFPIVVLKNIIFSIFWAFFLVDGVLYKSASKYLKCAFIGLIIFNPLLIGHALKIDLEEGYVTILFAYYWYLSLKSGSFTGRQRLMFLFLPVILLFLRNVFLYLCPVLFLFGLFESVEKRKLVIFSSLIFLIGILGLGYFNYTVGGKFTLKYTLEWLNIYKGNNELTLQYYPKYSVDILDYNIANKFPSHIKNEWEYNEYYRQLTLEYWKKHGIELKLLLIKVWNVWFEIRPNGYFPGQNPYSSPLKIIGVFFMFLFRLAQFWAISIALSKVFKSQNIMKSGNHIKFLLIIGSFLTLYTIAFGYERHLIPMIIPVFYYLFYCYSAYDKPRLLSPFY